jgi:hypothetical protein
VKLRLAVMLFLACCCTYLAAADARRATVGPVLDRSEHLDPLKADLAELGIRADELLGYQDDFFRKPDGSLMYLHLARLFLAPLRLVWGDEHEWLLVVRVEGPVADLDRSRFQKVKTYVGMSLWRRRSGDPAGVTKD